MLYFVYLPVDVVLFVYGSCEANWTCICFSDESVICFPICACSILKSTTETVLILLYQFMYYDMIKLRVCAAWSEPLLVAHTTLLDISCTHGILGGQRRLLSVWAVAHADLSLPGARALLLVLSRGFTIMCFFGTKIIGLNGIIQFYISKTKENKSTCILLILTWPTYLC